MTIEKYLAELRQQLRVGPLAKRRIVREIEAHLLDAAHREGEEQAIASFGALQAVAARFTRPARLRWLAPSLGTLAALGTGLAVVFGGPSVVGVDRLTGTGCISTTALTPSRTKGPTNPPQVRGNKVYDGSTTATINFGRASLSGVVDSDDGAITITVTANICNP